MIISISCTNQKAMIIVIIIIRSINRVWMPEKHIELSKYRIAIILTCLV